MALKKHHHKHVSMHKYYNRMLSVITLRYCKGIKKFAQEQKKLSLLLCSMYYCPCTTWYFFPLPLIFLFFFYSRDPYLSQVVALMHLS